MKLFVLLATACCLFSTAGRASVPPELLAALDAGATKQDIKGTERGVRGTASELELTWIDDNQEAKAWLLSPRKPGKAALVVYLHGENPVTQPRMFVDEAVALAGSGVASLHVSLPLAAAAAPGADDDATIKASVRRVQDAIAWARGQAGINGDRVAIVGQRYGAMIATVVAATDPKVDALALLAPPGKPSGWLQVSDRPAAQKLRATFDPQKWGPYLFGLAKFDTEVWLPHAKHAKTLMQFASQDDWTTTLEQVELFRAAKGTKERKSYDSDSKLNAEARADRMAWLKRVLQ